MIVRRDRRSIVLAREADVRSLRAIELDGSDPTGPRDWRDVLDAFSRSVSRSSVVPLRLSHFFSVNGVLFAWHPNLVVLLWVLFRRKLIYLCWGMPNARSALLQWLKNTRLRLILRRATTILVNDRVTESAILRLAGRAANIVPYVVDPRFFTFAHPSQRENFVLVPGDNARNERLIANLALRGISVVRVCRDARIAKFYASQRLIEKLRLEYRVSYGRLRELYQRASVVVVPIIAMNHAAGQTSVLEAIACGAPVVMSAAGAASIFASFETVTVCNSCMVDDWIEAIHRISNKYIIGMPEKLRLSSELVARHHCPEAVDRKLQTIIDQELTAQTL